VDKPLDWEYLGTPISPTANHPTSVWAGLPGFNWEVGNFFSLGKGDDSSDYLIAGAQFKDKDIAKLSPVMKTRIKPDCPGLPIWMSGEWTAHDGKIEYLRNATGMLDYGWYYACNSFEDPQSGRRILWGWILENDLSSMRRARNGWSGCMAIPRELTQLVIRDVVSTVSPDVALSDLDSCVVGATSTKAGIQVCTIRTLGMRPIVESRYLYGDGEPRVHLEQVVVPSGKTIPLGDVGMHWKMEMEVELKEPASSQLVVSLRHSPGKMDYSL
jgi:beta-fructofuranosidase